MRSVALPRDPPQAAGVRRLDLLTAPAVTAYLQRSDAALLALGPTEAHVRHLPLVCAHGPDVHTATLAARHAFERFGYPVAVRHPSRFAA